MMCYEILEISRRSEISYSILITSYEKITHTEHTIIPRYRVSQPLVQFINNIMQDGHSPCP